jgi:hypothetical protein
MDDSEYMVVFEPPIWIAGDPHPWLPRIVVSMSSMVTPSMR